MHIGIDMDGVLADFTTKAIENTFVKFGILIREEELKVPHIVQYIWERVSEGQREFFKEQGHMYDVICPKGFFENLDPLPGAIETVNKLMEKHEVAIITKPLEWTLCPGEKLAWLSRYFDLSKVEVIMTNQMKTKRLVDVDVIIDDDPRVLKELPIHIAGIAVKQPWNIDYLLTEGSMYFSVDNMTEVLPIIEQLDSY